MDWVSTGRGCHAFIYALRSTRSLPLPVLTQSTREIFKLLRVARVQCLHYNHFA